MVNCFKNVMISMVTHRKIITYTDLFGCNKLFSFVFISKWPSYILYNMIRMVTMNCECRMNCLNYRIRVKKSTVEPQCTSALNKFNLVNVPFGCKKFCLMYNFCLEYNSHARTCMSHDTLGYSCLPLFRQNKV